MSRNLRIRVIFSVVNFVSTMIYVFILEFLIFREVVVHTQLFLMVKTAMVVIGYPVVSVRIRQYLL